MYYTTSSEQVQIFAPVSMGNKLSGLLIIMKINAINVDVFLIEIKYMSYLERVICYVIKSIK